jgi:hypothetical protein
MVAMTRSRVKFSREISRISHRLHVDHAPHSSWYDTGEKESLRIHCPSELVAGMRICWILTARLLSDKPAHSFLQQHPMRLSKSLITSELRCDLPRVDQQFGSELSFRIGLGLS